MSDPTLALTTAIENATKVANTPLFTTVIDKVTGFKISKWAAEGEVIKKQIHDEYEIQKNNGIVGTQYVSALRGVTNLVNVGIKSSEYIDKDKENNIKIDNDFFWNTIEHAKTVSNEEMQDLIAKIIAGEYNNPTTYSMSTLYVLKSVDSQTLKNFVNILSISLTGIGIFKDLFLSLEDMNKFGVSYSSFLDLQDVGLISSNESLISKEGEIIDLYIDKKIHFKPKNEADKKITIPTFYLLTKAGREIRQHLQIKENPNFIDWLKKKYENKNFSIEIS